MASDTCVYHTKDASALKTPREEGLSWTSQRPLLPAALSDAAAASAACSLSDVTLPVIETDACLTSCQSAASAA